MAVPTAPDADLDVLPKADGSTTYKYAGYTITASVNGPIEAARRDEHPYTAHVDVIVRPAAGTGGWSFQHRTTFLPGTLLINYIGPRERHLESLLESSLSQIILVKDFPRCLIQIVLQVESAPQNDYVNTKLLQAGIVRLSQTGLLHWHSLTTLNIEPTHHPSSDANSSLGSPISLRTDVNNSHGSNRCHCP